MKASELKDPRDRKHAEREEQSVNLPVHNHVIWTAVGSIDTVAILDDRGRIAIARKSHTGER